jgi:hypothetical protein
LTAIEDKRRRLEGQIKLFQKKTEQFINIEKLDEFGPGDNDGDEKIWDRWDEWNDSDGEDKENDKESQDDDYYKVSAEPTFIMKYMMTLEHRQKGCHCCCHHPSAKVKSLNSDLKNWHPRR